MADKTKKLDMAVGIFITLAFVVLSNMGFDFFEKMERQLYNIGTRFTISDHVSADKITLIDIDDKSLADLGPWPWPRNIIAEMIEILNGEGAKLIGINIPFTEKEHNEGLNEVKTFREKYEKKDVDAFLNSRRFDNALSEYCVCTTRPTERVS